jgi:hypothetical protein
MMVSGSASGGFRVGSGWFPDRYRVVSGSTPGGVSRVRLGGWRLGSDPDWIRGWFPGRLRVVSGSAPDGFLPGRFRVGFRVGSSFEFFCFL